MQIAEETDGDTDQVQGDLITFYKDCPINVPGKGTYQRWFLINNSFIIRCGGLYNPVVWLYNPWSVCGDGGANLVYLSLAY